MKFSTTIAAVAAMATGAMAAHEKSTFAVLRFNGKQLTKGRMDPNVSPGKPSNHVHTIMGGSGFSMSATGDDLMKSECSNAKIKGDNSNYWFPSLYFKDPNNGSVEAVDVFYVNAYYFILSFEKSNDDIKAFPIGLKMISGDPDARTPPEGGPASNFNPDDGPVVPVKWTCPRSGNNYSPPSWPADSDGSLAGIGDPINKGEGVGFPDQNCDGYASPLRADIHFPSCYNPEAGLDKVGENMAWPSNTGDGNKDCPQGYIHVPHLFIEVYWDTPAFVDRWTQGTGSQPFVLSNGDATGYSSHADFLGGWEEDLLQHIIDTCDAGTAGMDNCPGLFHGLNEGECTIPSEVDEQVDGVLDALPGGHVLQGWSYGMPEQPQQPEEPQQPEQPEQPEQPQQPEETQQPEVPTVTEAPVVEAPVLPTEAPSTEQPSTEQPPAENPVEEQPAPSPSPVCETKIHTVWETVTVTAGSETLPTEPANPADAYTRKKARRDHVHHHRRHHL
ncbi:hypothetical protein HJFPF1_02936 [Paramyrothecium foliicola]|nr:hypothetical protein HJFPF1_02936 [Paramyrothecium foliicola]